MRKSLAVLVSGYALAGLAHAMAPAAPEPDAPRTAPQAYAGLGVGLVDYSGGGSKASPKLFGGYEFTNKLALEAGGIDFKKGYGLYIAVKPTVPLTEKLSVYGKVGVAKSRREILPIAALPAAPLVRKNDTGAYGAFGLQYSITPNTVVTAEYERFGKKKESGAKEDVWTLALKFFF
ncbi:outer membrane beta-barrel protein [Massilia sp. G4R7]|uniref:Outer membrane beta-barrel protein n=1 Tax=Massilia phyllostachyos TaxID=2898585 RepID=A0ABS8Q4D2_9BURK|nr:outer membrane beta-barrel protein [Massilia phyllostachyos]MCD2516612.1 outer membrane beta-barrel protein [Massilia phyllostachyos]